MNIFNTKSLASKIFIISLVISVLLVGAIVFKSHLETERLMVETEESIATIGVETPNRRFTVNYQLLQTAIGQITANKGVVEAFAARDREELAKLTLPMLENLVEAHIVQFQFHLPDNTSFFRVHMPENYGDDLSFREMIAEVHSGRKGIKGLEGGAHAIAFRHVEPIFYEGEYIGAIEVGMLLDQRIIDIFQRVSGGEWYVYSLDSSEGRSLGTTEEGFPIALTDDILVEIKSGETIFLNDAPYLIQIVPLSNFCGEVEWYLQRVFDNSENIAMLNQQRNSTILFGLAIAFAGFLIIFFLMQNLLKPISYLVERTKTFAGGDLSKKIEVKTDNEIGQLAETMELMRQSIHRSEQQLKRSRELFKTLSDLATDWIFWLDPKGEIIYTSPAGEWITGYTSEELEAAPELFDQMIHPEDQEHWITGIEEINKRGKTFQLECRIITKEGKTKWVNHVCRPIYNPQGEFMGIRGSNTDITQRKETEEALKNSEARFRDLFNNMSNGVAVFEVENEECGNCFTYQDINRSAQKIDDIEKEKVIGKVFCDVLPEAEESGLCDVVRRVRKTGKSEYFLATFYKDEKIVSWRENFIYKLPSGEIVIVFDDITKRRQAEEELKYVSFHDRLTGLYNRAHLENELQRVESEKEYPITIISADVDGLKLINDTMGHKKGDELLKTSAHILKKPLRKSDTIARAGGDEITVLLPQTDKKAADEIINRIQAEIKQHNQINDQLPLSISLGVATSMGQEQSLEETFKKADKLMYEDKLSRRGSARGQL